MRRHGGRLDAPGLAALAAFALAWLVADLVRGVPAWVGRVYVAASALAFALYAVDKRAAIGGRERIRERTLLAVGIAGGWPGAVVAQQLWRHKTAKPAFRVKFWVSVAANVGAFAAAVIALR